MLLNAPRGMRTHSGICCTSTLSRPPTPAQVSFYAPYKTQCLICRMRKPVVTIMRLSTPVGSGIFPVMVAGQLGLLLLVPSGKRPQVWIYYSAFVLVHRRAALSIAQHNTNNVAEQKSILNVKRTCERVDSRKLYCAEPIYFVYGWNVQTTGQGGSLNTQRPSTT